MGPWELPHPELPTVKTGAILDEFLLLPGDLVPDEWLPAEEPNAGVSGHHIIDLDKEYGTACAFPDPWVDDHHPVLRSLRGGEYPLPNTMMQRNQIRVKDLTKEE